MEFGTILRFSSPSVTKYLRGCSACGELTEVPVESRNEVLCKAYFVPCIWREVSLRDQAGCDWRAPERILVPSASIAGKPGSASAGVMWKALDK